MRKSISLDNVFPVWKIEDNCLLDKCGSVCVGFALMLPEIFTCDSGDYEKLHDAFVKAVAQLPVGTIMHKQDWFMTAKFPVDFSKGDRSFLQHNSDRLFFEKPWLDHRCYLFLTLPPTGRKAAAAFTSLVPPDTIDKKRIDAFMGKLEQCMTVLCADGMITAKRLVAADYESTAEKAGLLEQYCTLSGANDPRPENLRILRDITLGEGLAVGELAVQVFSLCVPDTLPAVVGPRITHEPYSTDQSKFSIGFAAPLGLLLPVDHIYNQYMIVEDKDAVQRGLEKKRLRMQSLSAYSRDNGINRDAVNGYLNELIGEGRLPVRAHVNLVCFSADEAGKRNVASHVAAAMAKIGARAKIETDSAAQLYWAGIPGNAFGLPVNETYLTFSDQAACFLNMETNYRSSTSPIGLRLCDRVNGIPVNVDLWDEPMRQGIITNRNMLVVGPSGSGKSVFCNHMQRTDIEQGAHVLIIDVGHSYRGLCELMGGVYLTHSETEPLRFNPFHIEGDLDTEKKESLKTLLLALWKKDDESFTRSEYVAVSNALDGYYQSVTAQHSFNSFYEYVQSDFKKKMAAGKVRQQDFDIDGFLYVLKPYYIGGEFDYLLNATGNLDLLEQRMIVFELDTIKDHPILFPVVTLVIMDVFITKMRKLKGVRKTILIEEAWKAIAKAGMAEYIKYLFKTIRKFYGKAIVVTQDIDDLIGSAIVKDTIINNSDTKVLLDMSRYRQRFDTIQSVLGLTDKEKMLVLSIKRREVFISLGGTHAKVFGVHLSPEELLAYTTEEKERELVKVFAKRYGSYKNGITVLSNQLK